MAKTVQADEVAGRTGLSPVFGDIEAKMKDAIHQEVERRLRLGLPVIVDEGRGIEDLSAQPTP